jgi:16S rRNA (adenine1518-N6/adenine1519-N6)-dimethyltransferase
MDKLHSSSGVKKAMGEHGLHFQKSLGQNFLTDTDILEQIVASAELDRDTCVLEIGPGAGTLTREIAREAHKVVAVEIDKNLIPLLTENTAEFDNVKIINNDILKLDLKALFAEEFEGKKVKVVANLPYYITTPIIMKLLEEKPGEESIVIMIQKEVAERLTANAGTKAYGAITPAVNYYSAPSFVCYVPPESFVPPPKVWSAVIRLDVLDKPPVEVLDETHFFKLIKAAFGQRRKTFLNSASSLIGTDKEALREVLISLGLPETARGETFSLVDFSQISNELVKINLCK